MAQIVEHAQMIDKGVKPLSILAIKNKEVDSINEFFSTNDCPIHFKIEYLDNSWSTLYIFKNVLMYRLIPHLPPRPLTPSDHTLLRLLCGYSIDPILEFITKGDKFEFINGA